MPSQWTAFPDLFVAREKWAWDPGQVNNELVGTARLPKKLFSDVDRFSRHLSLPFLPNLLLDWNKDTMAVGAGATL